MRRFGVLWVSVATATMASAAAAWSAPVAARGPVPTDERASVAFVGDSIGRDAEEEITAEISRTNPVVYYNAIGAGYTSYHLARLTPVVLAPDGPDIVIAELGTGDAFWGLSPERFEADVRDFLDTITPEVDCVLWIDQKPGGNRAYPMINDLAHAFNQIVHRTVVDYDNATYVHYAAWTKLAGAPSRYFLGDYLHLTPIGERDLARLVGSAVRGCDPGLTSGPFWDVQDDFWAARAINWAAGEGIVDGYDNNTYRAVVGHFRPPVTRGQATQMLWRMNGEPRVATAHGWTDVPPWLAPALRWGRFHQIVDGYPGDRFRPDEPVTRASLVRWLWRTAEQPFGFEPHPWSDAPRSLDPALRWAAAYGIMSGVGDVFGAAYPVDRAQMAGWLHATYTFLHPPAPPSTGHAAVPESTAGPATSPLTTLPPPPASSDPASSVVPYRDDPGPEAPRSYR